MKEQQSEEVTEILHKTNDILPISTNKKKRTDTKMKTSSKRFMIDPNEYKCTENTDEKFAKQNNSQMNAKFYKAENSQSNDQTGFVLDDNEIGGVVDFMIQKNSKRCNVDIKSKKQSSGSASQKVSKIRKKSVRQFSIGQPVKTCENTEFNEVVKRKCKKPSKKYEDAKELKEVSHLLGDNTSINFEISLDEFDMQKSNDNAQEILEHDQKLQYRKIFENPRPSVEPEDLGTLETYDEYSNNVQVFKTVNDVNKRNVLKTKNRNLNPPKLERSCSRSVSRKQLLNKGVNDYKSKQNDDKNSIPLKYSNNKPLNTPFKDMTNAKQNVQSNKFNNKENVEIISKKSKKVYNNKQNTKTNNNFGKSLTNKYTAYHKQEVIEINDESGGKRSAIHGSTLKPKYGQITKENCNKNTNSSTRGPKLSKRKGMNDDQHSKHFNKENCLLEQSARNSVHNENSCRGQNMESKIGYQDFSVERKSVSSMRSRTDRNLVAKNQQSICKNNQKLQKISDNKLESTQSFSTKSITTVPHNPRMKSYTLSKDKISNGFKFQDTQNLLSNLQKINKELKGINSSKVNIELPKHVEEKESSK